MCRPKTAWHPGTHAHTLARLARLAPWHTRTHLGTLAHTHTPWHPGTHAHTLARLARLAPWHTRTHLGTLARTLAPWHPGTLAPWHPGTHPGTSPISCHEDLSRTPLSILNSSAKAARILARVLIARPFEQSFIT